VGRMMLAAQSDKGFTLKTSVSRIGWHYSRAIGALEAAG
jgi:hypothetical protein